MRQTASLGSFDSDASITVAADGSTCSLGQYWVNARPISAEARLLGVQTMRHGKGHHVLIDLTQVLQD